MTRVTKVIGRSSERLRTDRKNPIHATVRPTARRTVGAQLANVPSGEPRAALAVEDVRLARLGLVLVVAAE
jgi:hypothetical protein